MPDTSWFCGEPPPPPLRITVWDLLTGSANAKMVRHAGQLWAWQIREHAATMSYIFGDAEQPVRRRRIPRPRT